MLSYFENAITKLLFKTNNAFRYIELLFGKN